MDSDCSNATSVLSKSCFFCLNLAMLLVSSQTGLAEQLPKSISVQIRESAGIRRFGYPVTVPLSFKEGALRDARQIRMVSSNEKAVAAQVSPITLHPDGTLNRVEIDLIMSPGPLAAETLRIDFSDAPAQAAPKGGLTFSETEETFQVSAYTIRKDANPLIAKVHYGRDYLKPEGLTTVAWRGDEELSLKTAERKWSVVKKGPYQVRLRCDGTYLRNDSAAELPFVITLEFVSSKSWIGVHQTVTPPAKNERPLSLGIAGHFQMSGRLLWDTDVDYWLYGVLEAGEQMSFSQTADRWVCELGKAERLTAYAKSTTPDRRARGWGHFQESRENGNVIAFGFRQPAENGNYRYSLDHEGKLQLQAESSVTNPMELQTYFHFIPVPAQHTARTSPAAMLLPLEVTILGSK